MAVCVRRLALLAVLGLMVSHAHAQDSGKKLRVVLVDGQNNHQWTATTPVMKKALEDTGRFTVSVATSPARINPPQKPKSDDAEAQAKYKIAVEKYKADYAVYREQMEKFHPDLTNSDVLVSNYNGDTWGKAFNEDLQVRLSRGSIGLVIVHAANNAFGAWKEYNLMIGMGWRGKEGGERLYLDDEGKSVRVENSKGDGSGHRYTGPFSVVVRDPEHPVTRGMPREWLHQRDELYDNMRGPIQNVRLLATAYSKGTKVHEPMIWTVQFGDGRVFHTPMGHDTQAMTCIGFQATLARGTEWAATGKVTIPLPNNFPTASNISTISTK